MNNIFNPTYDDVQNICIKITNMIQHSNVVIDAIVGISRGGLMPANSMSHLLKLPLIPISYSAHRGKGDDQNHYNYLPNIPYKNICFVDDISDSGYTLLELKEHYKRLGHVVYTASIYYKVQPNTEAPSWWGITLDNNAPWIIFPWEG